MKHNIRTSMNEKELIDAAQEIMRSNGKIKLIETDIDGFKIFGDYFKNNSLPIELEISVVKEGQSNCLEINIPGKAFYDSEAEEILNNFMPNLEKKIPSLPNKSQVNKVTSHSSSPGQEPQQFTFSKGLKNIDDLHNHSSSSQSQDLISNYKVANEWGIAGFILSFILPLQRFQFDVYELSVSELSDGVFAFNLLLVMSMLALLFSIVGISQNSSKYQQGLAWSGFIFNILFVLNMLSIFFKP